MAERSTQTAVAEDAWTSLRLGLVSCAVFSAVISLLTLASPIYSLQIFDKVLASYSIPTLVALTLLFGVLTLAFGLMDGLRARLLLHLGHLFDRTYAPIALAHQVRLLRGANPRDTPKALDDLQEVRAILNGNILPAVFDAPWIPIFLIVVYVIHPWLGLVALFGSLAIAALVARSQLTMRRLHTGLQEGQVSSDATLRLLARKGDSARALGMTERLQQSWASEREAAWRTRLASGDHVASLQAAIKTLRLLVQMALYGVGAWLVIRRELSPGLMVAAAIIMGRALGPAEQLAAQGSAIVSAFRGFRRLLALPADAVAEPAESDTGDSGETIEINNCYALPGPQNTPVLKGINLRLEAGRAIGVVGPAGSGKSVLLKVAVGAIRPVTGTARIGGYDAFSMSSERMARLVGYLPEHTDLFAGTILQNITRFEEGATEAVAATVAMRTGIHSVVGQLPKRYDTVLDENGAPLSSAQARLLALARALYRDPPILLLDQPDAALDPDGQAILVGLIGELRAGGKTIVCVTHNVRLLRIMDAIAVLDRGQLRTTSTEDFLQRAARLVTTGGTTDPTHSSQALR